MSEWLPPSARERLLLLRSTRSIAMVGTSAKPDRASYFVATYLLAKTPYTVWFVNPSVTEILGHPVYPSVDALPGVPDLVEVFRRTEDLPEVTDDAIRIGASALWFQLGLADRVRAAARMRCRAQGCDGPLREDRTRQVRGWTPSGWV